jgi:hypothetical protein
MNDSDEIKAATIALSMRIVASWLSKSRSDIFAPITFQVTIYEPLALGFVTVPACKVELDWVATQRAWKN